MESTDLVNNNFNLSNNNTIFKREGEKKLKANDFLRDLSELMEDDKFVRFFEKYMCSWSEIKSTVIYMKLYKEFKERYKEISNEELDKSIITYILCKIMRDNDLRPFTIRTIDNYYEKGLSKKKDFFDDLELFLKNKHNLTLTFD